MSMRSVFSRRQCRVRYSLDMFGSAIGAATAFARFEIDVETELGADHDLIADRFERLANQLLVHKRAVSLRRVEKGDADDHEPRE